MFSMKEFAERIVALRKAKDVTQVMVADAIGIPERSYQRYEAGASEPRIGLLMALADYYGISLDELAGRKWPKE